MTKTLRIAGQVVLLCICITIAWFTISRLTQSSPYDPTIVDTSQAAFSQPLASLNQTQEQSFILGRTLFHQYSAENQRYDLKGIGPSFNAFSCGDCHVRDGRGNPRTTPSLITKIYNSRTSSQADPTYGHQLHTRALHEDDLDVHTNPFANGTFISSRLLRGPLDSDSFAYQRIAPPIIGGGLIEAIPENWFTTQEDPDDDNNDGISGRIGWVDIEIGRFGWKATITSVKNQTLLAAFDDIGLTNSHFPACSIVETACTTKNDITLDQEKNLIFYARALAPPRSRMLTHESRAGETLFRQLGCSSCHSTVVPISRSDIVTSAGTIKPFSDFLLHNMGDELADPGPIAERDADEFRTAPLWGLGLQKTVSGSLHLLHDGRATTIDQAIVLHGGESARSSKSYQKLNSLQKKQILSYLESL